MKNFRKIMAVVLVLAMSVSLVACGAPAPASSVPAPVSTPAAEPASTPAAEPASTPAAEPASTPAAEPASTPTGTTEGSTPRNETLYMNGIQWGKPVDANPFSTGSNFFVMEQSDASRVLLWETLYMFNALDGKLYPLLADGDYVWNDAKTELTVKIKAAAKWSDGTPVTADDVVATFDAHVKFQSTTGVDYSQYIESVKAKDAQTVVFTAKADNLNPLKVVEYLPKAFVVQKAYIEATAKKVSDSAEKFKTETMFDAPHSGPYKVMYTSEQKNMIEREDNYWGKDPSMWGKLPAPKYIGCNAYADNAAGDAALNNGEVDVSQQYSANVQDFWEKNNNPISTYLDKAPYHLAGTMPSAYFNTAKEGLDQKAVRQAIAYSVDYDQVISTAMTNQSPTFTEYPRSLFNPSAAERETYKKIEGGIKDLQWGSKETDRAIKVLDDAGIKDTNGDGTREYNGKELSFKVECPKGWSDWNAALQVLADSGASIGIKLETYFPEAAIYTEDIQTGNFDIAMASPPGSSISNPWTRAYWTLYGFGGKFPERMSFGYSRLYNADVDAALAAIPTETDEAKLTEYYAILNKFYLDEVPSFALMYRPVLFHTVSETVWTGFPESGDGTNVPPYICANGYGIAALYHIANVA